MKRWIIPLGLAGLLVALAVYAWSRMNQDYEDDELEDEIPIEFDVPIEQAGDLAANGATGAGAGAADDPAAHDTGVGPGADLQLAAPSSDHEEDDLTVIRGIGPVFQAKLHDLGIRTFQQLANADPAQLEETVQGVGVDIPDWIEQARTLAGSQPA